MQIDLRVMELLSSKLCHDLISPVSAINNGVELIEDIGGSVVDEAMKLIGDSASQAARRLKLFRMAYGRAGSEENIGVKDVRQVAEQYVAGGKINLQWGDESVPMTFVEKRGSLKTLINMLILAEEILAYGGTVALHPMAEHDGIGCRMEIVGRNAQLTPAFQEALGGTGAIEELTPRTIQPYITGRFANYFGLQIKPGEPATDRLDLLLSAA